MFVVVVQLIACLASVCPRRCSRSRMSHAYASLDCWFALPFVFLLSFSFHFPFPLCCAFAKSVRVPRVCMCQECNPTLSVPGVRQHLTYASQQAAFGDGGYFNVRAFCLSVFYMFSFLHCTGPWDPLSSIEVYSCLDSGPETGRL